MSTGLFQDEEDGYNIESKQYNDGIGDGTIDETKFKLKVPTEEPVADDLGGLDDFADADAGADDFEGLGGEEGLDDKPFDDEPFDAEVEADEESDPKTFIQQLAGKLGQSLRAYSDQQGSPDFDLEKFAVNSVLSATHTAEMDAEDQKDIINKVKSSGKGEGDIDVNVDVDTGGDEEDVNVNTDGGDGGEDLGFDDEDVAEENFQLGEGKTPSENLENSEKKPNFVSDSYITNKLREYTMNEIKEAPVRETPTIVPETKPDVKPNRRQKPWRIKPNVSPKPKAGGNESLMNEEGDAGSGKVIDTRYLTNKEAILRVNLDDNEIDIKFENTDEYNDKPLAYDEPWVYNYHSVDAPDGKTYAVGVEFYGHPDTHLELAGVHDDYLEVVDNE